MHLNDLKKLANRRWLHTWETRWHEDAIHHNNPWSIEWFYACRNNNPVPPPPNNNPTEIDDLIEQVRRASEQMKRREAGGTWVN